MFRTARWPCQTRTARTRTPVCLTVRPHERRGAASAAIVVAARVSFPAGAAADPCGNEPSTGVGAPDRQVVRSQITARIQHPRRPSAYCNAAIDGHGRIRQFVDASASAIEGAQLAVELAHQLPRIERL